MNVLEKILEELESLHNKILKDEFAEQVTEQEIDSIIKVKKIIRSHMDEIPKCGECSRRKWYQKGYEDGRKDNGWIPVEKKLPEVQEGLEDMYCPEFNVTIKGAERTTTLKYSWDGTWFDDYGTVYNVIAWQPLPERYKGGDDRA